MARVILFAACLFLLCGSGCQTQSRLQLFGPTRVPSPPTHSYSKPQSYYQQPSTPAPLSEHRAASGSNNTEFSAIDSESESRAIGTGVMTNSSASSGTVLAGMPINDATLVARRKPTFTSPRTYELMADLPSTPSTRTADHWVGEWPTNRSISPAAYRTPVTNTDSSSAWRSRRNMW